MTEHSATDAPINFEVVPAPADALAYVLSTWGRFVETRLEATPQPGFLKAFAPLQAALIKRSSVLLAMHAKRIASFIVYEPAFMTVTKVDREEKAITFGSPTSSGVLHWIATRREMRGRGIGGALLKSAGLRKPLVTFWTPDLRHLGLAEAPFTPFWLRTHAHG